MTVRVRVRQQWRKWCHHFLQWREESPPRRYYFNLQWSEYTIYIRAQSFREWQLQIGHSRMRTRGKYDWLARD